MTTLCLGEPAATVGHVERGTTLYDPERDHTYTFRFGQDPGVAFRALGAVALWPLGYPDRVLVASREAATRRVLSEAMGWFTEGFYIRDLQEAKALREEVGG